MKLELMNINKTYFLGKTEIKALKNINLKIEEGEFVCIIGKSGSGKTSLLNIIGLLDKPDEKGEIFFDGVNISKLKQNDYYKIRNENIGFVFQSFNLIPVLNVYENIELPFFANPKKYKNINKRERIIKLLEEIELKDFIKHKPDEISAGQRQRVAIARALVTNPKIVLADEPTANLDSETGKIIINLLKKINQIEKTTFIFATHDLELTSFANKIYNLKDGKIIL